MPDLAFGKIAGALRSPCMAAGAVCTLTLPACIAVKMVNFIDARRPETPVDLTGRRGALAEASLTSTDETEKKRGSNELNEWQQSKRRHGGSTAAGTETGSEDLGATAIGQAIDGTLGTSRGTRASSSPIVKDWFAAHQVQAGDFVCFYPEMTVKQVWRALLLQRAFQQVLDDPAAAEALQHPALEPMLDLVAD